MQSVIELCRDPKGAAILAVVAATLLVAWRRRRRHRRSFPPPAFSEDVAVVLLPRWSLSPNPSPPCLKLETFLRLAKIPHSVRANTPPEAGPTGRWPYISHRGAYVSDSQSCIDYLTPIFAPAFDSHLSDEQKALGTLVATTLEAAVYFGMVRIRWVDNAPTLFSNFDFGAMPNFVKNRFLTGRRKDVIRMLNSQGCGDRSDSDYISDMSRQLEAVVRFLPKIGRFFGDHDKPCSFDAIIFAYLQSLLGFPYAVRPAFLDVLERPAVSSYVNTVRKAAFPDWDEVCRQKGEVTWKPSKTLQP